MSKRMGVKRPHLEAAKFRSLINRQNTNSKQKKQNENHASTNQKPGNDQRLQLSQCHHQTGGRLEPVERPLGNGFRRLRTYDNLN
jgi:hypothetical protein